MSITLVSDTYFSSTLPGYVSLVHSTVNKWGSYGYDYFPGSPSPPTNLVTGMLSYGNAWTTLANPVASMGKIVLATDYFSALSGNANNAKSVEISADLVWRRQSNTYNPNSSWNTTYLGLLFAAPDTGVSGYAALITRTGGTGTTTTGRLVRIDKTSSFASPTFTDIGGAAVPLPTAANGERWKIKAVGSFFVNDSFASWLVTFIDATGTPHSIGMSTPIGSWQYFTDTNQTPANTGTWASGKKYVGFINRPGWKEGVPGGLGFVSTGYFNPPYFAPNSFDNLRIRDIGPLANITSATPSYTFATVPSYTTASVSTEENATAYSLPVNPSWNLETADNYDVTTFVSDSGDRVAYPRSSRRRRKWSFRWSALDDSEKASLATLNSNVKGRFATFSWTDPETALAIKIRFTSDLQFAKSGPSVWTASADVEEVF